MSKLREVPHIKGGRIIAVKDYKKYKGQGCETRLCHTGNSRIFKGEGGEEITHNTRKVLRAICHSLGFKS